MRKACDMLAKSHCPKAITLSVIQHFNTSIFQYKKMSDLLEKINDYIAAHPCQRKPKGLYEPVEYTLAMGGKRVRPTLMLLAYGIYRDDAESIMKQAVALETYHNFTLLHDDLMDDADLRRGKPTVHSRWGANTAILSGDAMTVLAFRDIADCTADKVKPVVRLFTETALEVCEGQQMDMEFESRQDVTETEYMEMIRLKTSVLLACALKMGAMLADAPQDDCDKLYAFGEQLGLAFQLQDDYLDVYGDPAVFGKAIGGDILSDKKTYMLINAFLRATPEQRDELNRWIGNKTCDPKEKIKAVTDLYNIIGIGDLARHKIEECFANAHGILASLNVTDDRKHDLLVYVDSMMGRRK